MGRFGWHSGYVKAQNIQSGSVDLTIQASTGDGSAAVTFPYAFKTTPIVVLTHQEPDTTGTLSAVGVSTSGFTCKVDGSSITAGNALTIGYVAMDYSA